MSLVEKIRMAPTAEIRDAIVRLNETAVQIVLVCDDAGRLLGTLTDGDIRRAVLSQVPLNSPVERIMSRSPKTLPRNERHRGRELMEQYVISNVPLLDEDGVVVDLLRWRDMDGVRHTPAFKEKPNRVFILAGGKGTRLKPFTNILPKPLIPLGETPILETIMQSFQNFGFNRFILSLNYKAEMIRLYFAENPEKFEIEYVQEKEFLGTAGSLHLVKDRISETLIVANCDVLLDIDFDDFLEFHRRSGNAGTIVGVVRHIRIPYGVLDLAEEGLVGIREKPEIELIVNAGVYAVEPSVLKRLADHQYAEMPATLDAARRDGLKVGVYPVSCPMIDVGRWEDYEAANTHYHTMLGRK